MEQLAKILVLLFVVLVNGANNGRTGKIVSTNTGKVKGIVSLSRQHREFYSWRGIPYAEPPLRDLRYETPVPVKPWKGVLPAVEYGDVCAQRQGGIVFGSEDCLSLNVFTPSSAFDRNRKLPVMVFIHGGIFVFWSSQTFEPHYFMDEDVVLVTINYRLASFGFLSTGDGLVRGNMGLKDQAVALRWINENIEAFGGDRTRITIFGESAGAVSVHYHMMSPMSRGLFQQGISESGVATAIWATKPDPAKQARRFANDLNCPSANTTAMVACLKGKSFYEILRIHDLAAFKVFWEFQFPDLDDLFLPVVETIDDEEAYLTEHPTSILKRGDYDQVPWMTGVNSAEGLFIAIPYSMNPKLRRALDLNWETEVNVQFFLSTQQEVERSVQVRKFYMSNVNVSSLDALPEYTKMMSDRYFVMPLYKALQFHANRAPTYAYHYAKRGPSVFNVFLKFNERIPKMLGYASAVARNWVDVNVLRKPRGQHGVGHTDELFMLAPFVNLFYVGKHHPDYEFSKDFVKLWANFATNHSSMAFRGLRFHPLQPSDEPTFFELDEKPKLVQLGLKQRVDLWDYVTENNQIK